MPAALRIGRAPKVLQAAAEDGDRLLSGQRMQTGDHPVGGHRLLLARDEPAIEKVVRHRVSFLVCYDCDGLQRTVMSV